MMCRYNMLHHMLMGAAFGGAAALPLFRRTRYRVVTMSVGAGMGIGFSITECNYRFERPTLYDPTRIYMRPRNRPIKKAEAPTEQAKAEKEEEHIKEGDEKTDEDKSHDVNLETQLVQETHKEQDD